VEGDEQLDRSYSLEEVKLRMLVEVVLVPELEEFQELEEERPVQRVACDVALGKMVEVS